jgi:uncharacterized protein
VDAARDDAALHAAIRAAGFDGADVAVEPFRSGSMNEMLADPERWRRA